LSLLSAVCSLPSPLRTLLSLFCYAHYHYPLILTRCLMLHTEEYTRICMCTHMHIHIPSHTRTHLGSCGTSCLSCGRQWSASTQVHAHTITVTL
jgi:hypothetical protein